jgi:hypothetical protein
MTQTSEKRKLLEGLVALGLSLSEAVARTLACSLSEFARRHGFRHTEVSMCLLAYHQRIYPEIRDAIAVELDMTRDEIDALIEAQRERNVVSGEPETVTEPAA